MIKLILYIKEKYPREWLSNLYNDIDEAGVEIKHPKNKDEYLTILALPEIIGIGVLLEKDRDNLLDLSGFDFSFDAEEVDEAKEFFDYFFEEGEIKGNKNV